ncbi:MAG: hypothetical protein KFF73_00685 [Cyclobacteriaceae bacterium]|nr:hypothetical protein [Cyclobacteriaceae bacterium]
MTLKKHAVIMFTDIAGYMALKETDDKKAFDQLHRNKRIHHQIISKHHGKLIREIEDGILASFDCGYESSPVVHDSVCVIVYIMCRRVPVHNTH